MANIEFKKSVSVRLLIIGFISLVLLIPSFLIMNLISERKDRRDQVSNEISNSWGAKQTLVGPILNIPFKFQYYDENKNRKEGIRYAHFLPEKFDIAGQVNPEVRNRGIYEVVVYNSDLDITGEFSAPDINELKIREDLIFEDAFISFGISDMKGVNVPLDFAWNGEKLQVNSGVESNDLFSSGISINVKIDDQKTKYLFKANLNLNGSSELLFTPVGKETNIRLSSNWTNPSFVGNYIPIKREVNESGFNSNWKILHVSRDFPQQWVGSKYKVDSSTFGVNLLLSVDEYQKTMRTVKYAIMFIVLTFMAFFIIEILSKKAIHPIQYLLVGFALLLFYTLLLSLSEYMAFKFAFLIASSAIIIMISLYSISVLADKTKSYYIASLLIILYGYLYIILQLQDYALLMGSIILFVALALMMYLTRKIDWYNVLNNPKVEE